MLTHILLDFLIRRLSLSFGFAFAGGAALQPRPSFQESYQESMERNRQAFEALSTSFSLR